MFPTTCVPDWQVHLQSHFWLADAHVKVTAVWALNQIKLEFTRVQPGAEFAIFILVTVRPAHNPPNLAAACPHSKLLPIVAQSTRSEQDAYGVPRSATLYTGSPPTTAKMDTLNNNCTTCIRNNEAERCGILKVLERRRGISQHNSDTVDCDTVHVVLEYFELET